MLQLALLPFLLQGLAMFFDEFWFHRKRGLPLWERIGHPLDTITVLFCYAIPFFSTFSHSFYVFLMGALFSSLFVTKDEFVHAKYCDSGEQWLHSLLFVLHPLQFVSAALFWAQRDGVANILETDKSFSNAILNFQLFTVCFFLFYQLIYWNIIWPSKQKSTTTSITA